jgi:hypothetical protein
MGENIKSVYYPPYDVFVDSETGEITLPICKCTEKDSCIFMKNWIEDDKPTHVPKEELDRINKWNNDEDAFEIISEEDS